MKKGIYTSEFTLELQRRINTLEKEPARGCWSQRGPPEGCCFPVQGEGLLLPGDLWGSSQCQPSVWPPRTHQPKRPEHLVLADHPKMHLVRNMTRHLQQHLNHKEIQETVQQGEGRHGKAGITRLSFPSRENRESTIPDSEEHEREQKSHQELCCHSPSGGDQIEEAQNSQATLS